jgi:hypothetical protein
MMTGLCVFAQNGIIRELSGTVELKNPGAADYVPAKTGDTVSQKTVISTGFKSSTLVQVGSAVLTVRPLTRLTLTEISAASGAETLNVNLQAGRVRVDVNPPAGTRAAMSVSSPSATASVRGTSFEFDTRNLYVNHGTVSFKGSRGSGVLVSAGSSSQVQTDGKAVHPVETKIGNLRPHAPVGSSSGGNTSVTSVPEIGDMDSNGHFNIILNY